MGSWSITGNALGSQTSDFLGTTDNNALVVKTNNAERLRVDPSGNVGIATTSPAKPLDVAGKGGIRIGQTEAASTDNEVYFADNGQIRSFDQNHRILFNRTTNDLELREYGTITLSPGASQGQRTAQVFVESSGKVGVGTTAPLGVLHVVTPAPPTSSDVLAVNGILIEANSSKGGSPRLGLIDTAQGSNTSAPTWYVDNAGDTFRIFRQPNVSTAGASAGLMIDNKGNVTVPGDIVLAGADCAEHFDLAGANMPEPGTVVVIADEGGVRESQDAYDKKVAGVVSGAGAYRQAILMDSGPSAGPRVPLALTGKVYCKVDAQDAPIETGDLLTTSHTPGHAMKATDAARAFGAVIGKALRPLAGGQGLIPILVCLQ